MPKHYKTRAIKRKRNANKKKIFRRKRAERTKSPKQKPKKTSF
jgi:hypothetical protein